MKPLSIVCFASCYSSYYLSPRKTFLTTTSSFHILQNPRLLTAALLVELAGSWLELMISSLVFARVIQTFSLIPVLSIHAFIPHQTARFPEAWILINPYISLLPVVSKILSFFVEMTYVIDSVGHRSKFSYCQHYYSYFYIVRNLMPKKPLRSPTPANIIPKSIFLMIVYILNSSFRYI